MRISIRLARKDDLKDYTDLLQRTYQDAYPDEKVGLTKDHFSKEVFSSDRIQAYLKSNIGQTNKLRAWLAFSGTKMIGAITIEDEGNECHVKGFYIAPEYQGEGVGKKLWLKAQNFAKGKDIKLELYAHNLKSIEIYKKWGFKIDKEKDSVYRHWPEWPEGVRHKSIFMRFSSPSNSKKQKDRLPRLLQAS